MVILIDLLVPFHVDTCEVKVKCIAAHFDEAALSHRFCLNKHLDHLSSDIDQSKVAEILVNNHERKSRDVEEREANRMLDSEASCVNYIQYLPVQDDQVVCEVMIPCKLSYSKF